MTIYAAFHVSDFTHNFPHNIHEHLLLANTDLPTLRTLINEHFNDHMLIATYGTKLHIPENDMVSNKWCSSVGGSQASGYIELRELPEKFK